MTIKKQADALSGEMVNSSPDADNPKPKRKYTRKPKVDQALNAPILADEQGLDLFPPQSDTLRVEVEIQADAVNTDAKRQAFISILDDVTDKFCRGGKVSTPCDNHQTLNDLLDAEILLLEKKLAAAKLLREGN